MKCKVVKCSQMQQRKRLQFLSGLIFSFKPLCSCIVHMAKWEKESAMKEIRADITKNFISRCDLDTIKNNVLYCPRLFMTPRQSCLMGLSLSVLACLCLLLTDRTREEPSTSTLAATPRPSLWCRPEPSMCHAHTITITPK